MPDNKTDHKVNLKFLTKRRLHEREFALRAGSGNFHTNCHYSEEVSKKKWDN